MMITAAIAFLNDEHRHGSDEAAQLLTRPIDEWPRHGLRYGTLSALLDAAHAELDRDANRAISITAFVLQQAPHAHVPSECAIYGRTLRARAQKDHGSALLATGELSPALRAARHATTLFERDGLWCDAAAARLLEAIVTEHLGESRQALTILQGCVATFSRFDDAKRLLQARTMTAVILYRAEDYAEAERVFQEARIHAEQLGDELESARINNNLGHCAIQLDHARDAAGYFADALRYFEELGMAAERPRVFSGIAKLLANARDLDTAIWIRRTIRDEFLDRGLVVDAAEAGLSLLELLHAKGEREQVIAVSNELAAIFSRIGMPQNLARAMAYLSDAARGAPYDEFSRALRHVRMVLAPA
jgi:tetratricopeptide (TPR) repeat protein